MNMEATSMKKILNKINEVIYTLENTHIPKPIYIEDNRKVCDSCGGTGRGLTGSYECGDCAGVGNIRINYQEYVSNLPD